MNVTILIALGANLPASAGSDPISTCRAAIGYLDVTPGYRLRALSRWWRTEPDPPSDQPDYVNGVAAFTAAETDPVRILGLLQAVENRLGRVRGSDRYAARTIDLDLIDMAGQVRAAPDPILPHPRAHLRSFVLAPLAEVAPAWVHPVLGVAAANLLAGISREGIAPLE